MSIPPEPPPFNAPQPAHPNYTPQGIFKPLTIGNFKIPFGTVVRATLYVWVTWTALDFVYDEVVGRLALHRLESQLKKSFRPH